MLEKSAMVNKKRNEIRNRNGIGQMPNINLTWVLFLIALASLGDLAE